MSSPRNVAQGLADHLNGVLNATVTDARLTLLADPRRSTEFTLACLRETVPATFALNGTTLRLSVLQRIQVVGDHCRTQTYQYKLALTDEKPSWLLRWEYLRQRPQPDYRYPLAHMHVNGSLAPTDRVELPKLHIPTRRVPLELILWHLIAEWGVAPRTGDWQHVLSESLAGFEDRREAP